MMEQILGDFAHAYGLRYIALRYFNASGSDPEGEIGEWHEPETHLRPIVLEASLGKRSHIGIFGADYDTPDGTCIHDFIHVMDLADAHSLALEHLKAGGESGAHSLGTGQGHSVREVIDVCREISRRPIPAIEGVRRPGDPARLVADPARSLQKLGRTPSRPQLSEIADAAWQWMQSRKTYRRTRIDQGCRSRSWILHAPGYTTARNAPHDVMTPPVWHGDSLDIHFRIRLL